MTLASRVSRTVAASLLAATLGSPLAAQVLKVTPDFETRATSLIGHVVTDPKGRPLGKVDDLLIQKDGKVGFIVLSVARALGIGAKMVAVPYPKISAQGDKLFFKGKPEELKNANSVHLRTARDERMDPGRRPRGAGRHGDGRTARRAARRHRADESRT